MASPAYEARNKRARALGYKSYYDYRAHDNGKIPPSQPRLSGQRLARARGHRGQSDLRKSVRQGSLVIFHNAQRNADGTWKWVELAVVDPTGRRPDRVFRLRGDAASRDALRRLVRDIEAAGAIGQPIRAYVEKVRRR